MTCPTAKIRSALHRANVIVNVDLCSA